MKFIKFFAFAAIFATIFVSCEKQELETDVQNPIKSIKENTVLINSYDGYDEFVDVNGTKILIPNNEKKEVVGNVGLAVLMGVYCDQDLRRMFNENLHCYYYDCVGVGNTCKWLEIENPETGQMERAIVVCQNMIY